MHLIIPLGGLSRRYGLPRPKWLMTHPDGRYMIEHAVDCMIAPRRYTRIHFVLTQEVMAEFNLPADIIHRVFGSKSYANQISAITLHSSSLSQLETVVRAVAQQNLQGPATIKDCDNSFDILAAGTNYIATRVVDDQDDIRRLQMKSFVRRKNGQVTDVIEKRVISNEFCAGAYGFEEIHSLVSIFDRLGRSAALYMSDAINALIDQGSAFSTIQATAYEDWGTVDDWLAYCSPYRNLLIDIDGVIFENGSRALEPRWGANEPIKANVEALKRIMGQRVKIYFLTARGEEYRAETEAQLRAAGLRWEALIMGLFHAKRVLVNDFSSTPGSQWPTAEAINVIRNSSDLATIINYWPTEKR